MDHVVAIGESGFYEHSFFSCEMSPSEASVAIGKPELGVIDGSGRGPMMTRDGFLGQQGHEQFVRVLRVG